ncbi:MAG TPA: hypothetical protein VK989_07075 [Polyangia bacterium]|nr:hypothetical protein [Polyangia bacterium]
MSARARVVALGLGLLGASCQTVDLGAPPADINACRPSESFFVQQVWPNVLAKDYAGRKCSDATCHDPSTGRPLSLIPSPMPALDPTQPAPMPLPDDWANNYRSTTEQMSCGDVEASNLIEYPTATKAHGGGQLFGPASPEVTTIMMWVTAP